MWAAPRFRFELCMCASSMLEVKISPIVYFSQIFMPTFYTELSNIG